MNKIFYSMDGIGRTKYSISFHNGESKHNDGSPFYDIKFFKSKKAHNKFKEELLEDGYNSW